MHEVGKQPRSEFVSDPKEAIIRGAKLDRMLMLANIPRKRGVRRMSHAQMNAEDFERSLQMAGLLNKEEE